MKSTVDETHFDWFLIRTGGRARLAEAAAKEVAPLKVDGEALKVMAIAGPLKKGNQEVACKTWLADQVSGGIVKPIPHHQGQW
jgi:hypothetical protein